ncbi:MAG: hypothetical protein JKX85_10480 [Phycisphaeraceae bacterium]|nr:hypothetical protein [Phycisphaeraceae bacterium]
MQIDWTKISDLKFRKTTNVALAANLGTHVQNVRNERLRRLAADRNVKGPDGRKGGNNTPLSAIERTVQLPRLDVPESMRQAVVMLAKQDGVAKAQIRRDALAAHIKTHLNNHQSVNKRRSKDF